MEALTRSAKDNSYMFYEPSEATKLENKDDNKLQENEFFKSLQDYRKNDINRDNINYGQNLQFEVRTHDMPNRQEEQGDTEKSL